MNSNNCKLKKFKNLKIKTQIYYFKKVLNNNNLKILKICYHNKIKKKKKFQLEENLQDC